MTRFADESLSVYPIWTKVLLSTTKTHEAVQLVFHCLKTDEGFAGYSLALADITLKDRTCSDVINDQGNMAYRTQPNLLTID